MEPPPTGARRPALVPLIRHGAHRGTPALTVEHGHSDLPTSTRCKSNTARSQQEEARGYIRTTSIGASVAITSYALDLGAVNSDAPYAVGAGPGLTFGRDRPSTQPTPHMRKRRALHGHTLHRHADTRSSPPWAAKQSSPSPQDTQPPSRPWRAGSRRDQRRPPGPPARPGHDTGAYSGRRSSRSSPRPRRP